MRRTARLTVRILAAAALVAAVLDVPLPGGTPPRLRIHLLDRSASVLHPRPPADSVTPEESRRLAEWDVGRATGHDRVLWACFGADVAFESTHVDPRSTEAGAAIEAALARGATEIVLHTDGRGDPGRATGLARARGVPVHVLPCGPTSVRDVRLSRISAPAAAAPGARVRLAVEIASTVDTTATVTLGGRSQEVSAGPGAPGRAVFDGVPPGPFDAAVEADDDYPENNRVRGRILATSERPRVVVLGAPVPLPEGFAPADAADGLHGAVAVIVNDTTPPEPLQRQVSRWVSALGGGLLLLGGRHSFARGGWEGTPLEEASPLDATPDHRVAVVFAIDGSGSMTAHIDKVIPVVRAAWRSAGAEFVRGLWCSQEETAVIRDPEALRRAEPRGGTAIAESLLRAAEVLKDARPRRKHVFLLTDGIAARDETEEERRRAATELEKAGVTLHVVTSDRPLGIGNTIPIGDWAKLEAVLAGLLLQAREPDRENPGPLDLAPGHPVRRGVTPGPLGYVNLTKAKPGTDVAGTVGRDDVYPVVAFRPFGRGRVGALAFPAASAPAGLIPNALRHVAGEARGGLVLSVDPPFVRARGEGPPEIEALAELPSGRPATVLLRQVSGDAWEGTLPETSAGTVFVRIPGGPTAAATVASSPELRALGLDREALRRIAAETGGRVLGGPGDLESLPRPEGPSTVGGRPVFLVAALLLIFTELAISTFWKA